MWLLWTLRLKQKWSKAIVPMDWKLQRERTKKAFLGLGSRSLGVVQCGGVGLELNRHLHHLQASATHSECRSKRGRVMVEVWWSLLGADIPTIVAGQAFRIKRRRTEEQRIKGAHGREKTSDDIFVCERVCTSKRMLKKVGSFSKDPIPDTCVTVCGVSELDACSGTVCVNQHQVPNWNDICLRRCQSECLKLSASRAS
ncbi:hypothetical protein ACSBR2_009207 [Camellia fascicularis]